jgi:DNA-directed RNA polymerase subunit RPC12/RpoP
MRKKTHEEFVKEVYELVGNEYEVLGEYVNARTKIYLKHTCGDKFYMRPNNFLNGQRCPKCSDKEMAKKKRKLNEDYADEIDLRFGKEEYEFLSKYENSKLPIIVKHVHCGYTWNPIAGDLLSATLSSSGVYCPNCNGLSRKDTEKFREIVSDLTGDEYIVLGEYINNKTKIKMKHNISDCSYEYNVSPLNFYRNGRCPKCSGNSKGEYEISNFLNANEILHKHQYTFNDCRNNNLSYPLIFDFAVFDNKKEILFIIEYDGQHHFEPVDFAGKGVDWADEQFIKNKLHDQIKNQYCKDKNISLYRIPYWHFDNIEEILNKIINNGHVEVDETSFLIV